MHEVCISVKHRRCNGDPQIQGKFEWLNGRSNLPIPALPHEIKEVRSHHYYKIFTVCQAWGRTCLALPSPRERECSRRTRRKVSDDLMTNKQNTLLYRSSTSANNFTTSPTLLGVDKEDRKGNPSSRSRSIHNIILPWFGINYGLFSLLSKTREYEAPDHLKHKWTSCLSAERTAKRV